jgi:hypothetical protein
MPVLQLPLDATETFQAVQGLNTLIFQKRHVRGQMADVLKDNPKDFEKTIPPIDNVIAQIETLRDKLIKHYSSYH